MTSLEPSAGLLLRPGLLRTNSDPYRVSRSEAHGTPDDGGTCAAGPWPGGSHSAPSGARHVCTVSPLEGLGLCAPTSEPCASQRVQRKKGVRSASRGRSPPGPSGPVGVILLVQRRGEPALELTSTPRAFPVRTHPRGLLPVTERKPSDTIPAPVKQGMFCGLRLRTTLFVLLQQTNGRLSQTLPLAPAI